MSTVGSSGNTFLDSLGGSTAAAGTAGSNAATAKEASERFLKLLVTQLQNQDPMNPVDNAQMTSQMAQISTVSGIEKLNTTVEKLNGQFVQMQALQGASLVGKDVLVPGDKLAWIDDVPYGTFELGAAASRVKVEVLSPAGRLVDTLNIGALPGGRHDVPWPAGVDVAEAANYRFRVTASSGNTPIDATMLMRDRIDAVNTGGSTLTVELVRGGRLPYTQITALD
jgi:flagellar basal-body rod modification protein FlgD